MRFTSLAQETEENMSVKQVSVFMSNTEGRLLKVTDVLSSKGINLLAASLAEASDFGVIRLITEDADKAKEVLKEAGCSAKISDVVAVKVADEPGSLHAVLDSIKDFNIEYMYAMAVKGEQYIILKIHDYEKAEASLTNAGFKLF